MKTVALNLEDSHVGQVVGGNQLGLEPAVVVRVDSDVVGILDHMAVGNDVTFAADDDAGTERRFLFQGR